MKQLMENWRRYLNEEKDVVEETEEVIEEAEYQGRKVKLNDPIRTPDGAIKRKIRPRLVTGLAGNGARAQRWIADETYNGKLEKISQRTRRGF